MKTKILLLLMISTTVASFLSCKRDTITALDNDPNTMIICGTKDPLNELKWLSNEMKHLDGGSGLNGIVLFEYKNNQVIEIQCSLCSSTNIHQYYCDGTKLDFISTTENVNRFKDYIANRKKIKILYGTEVWR